MAMRGRMRGILHYLTAFVMVVVILLVFFFMANPMLLNFNSGLAEAGQSLITMANETLNGSVTGAQLVDSMNIANQGIINSSTVIAYIIKYAWLIFLIVIGAIFFLMTRKDSEVGHQGGLI